MVIENATPIADVTFQAATTVVTPFINKLNVLVGGIFGLYLILVLMRIHYERKKVKALNDVRYNLDKLNQHYGLQYAGGRMTWGKRGINFTRRMWHSLTKK